MRLISAFSGQHARLLGSAIAILALGSDCAHASETLSAMIDRLCQANGIERGIIQSARIVHSSQLNAYTDGRRIVMYSRLWQLLATDDARAFVVSHELSHILLNHRRNGVARKVGTQVLNKAVGLTLGPVASIGTYAGLKLANLKFSRQQEYGADEKGLALMCRAGYNPDGARQLFESLKAVQGADGHGPEFLLTHPLDEHRLSQLSARYRQPGPVPAQTGIAHPATATDSALPLTGTTAGESWSSQYQPATGIPSEPPTFLPPASPAAQAPNPPPNFYNTDPLPDTSSPGNPLPSPADPTSRSPTGRPVIVTPPTVLPPPKPPRRPPFQNPWGSPYRNKPNRYGMTPVLPPSLPVQPEPAGQSYPSTTPWTTENPVSGNTGADPASDATGED